MAEKYYGLSAFSYCADNPFNNQDVEGCSIIKSIVSAVVDYGIQFYGNYEKGMKGREAWYDEVDFADVALSLLVPTKKLKIASSLLINAAKEVFDYSPNEKPVFNTNVGEVVKDAAINTAIDIGVEKVSKIATEYAQSAKKEVEQAVKEASHKQNISRNRPNSTKRREAAIIATENM